MKDGKKSAQPNIKVIGIGGGAIRALNHMIECGMQGIEFITVSGDSYALQLSKAHEKILIGEKRFRGLGHLTLPVCREITAEAKDILKQHLCGADVVFVVACLGGSTGSGAASLVASYARELGIFTVVVATWPFAFEGRRRRRNAESGINEIKNSADTAIVISDDCIMEIIDKKTSLSKAFNEADDIIYRCVQSITDLIMLPGLIDVGLEDIKKFLSNAGFAKIGYGSRKNNVKDAVLDAISSPLLENGIEGSNGVLLKVNCGENVSLLELMDVTNQIDEVAGSDIEVVFGALLDRNLFGNEIQVTAIVLNQKYNYVQMGEEDTKTNAQEFLGGIEYKPKSNPSEEQNKKADDFEPFDIPGWMQKPQEKHGYKSQEDLSPRHDGKKVCSYLRNIRVELAKANNIPFESADCDFTGNCAGTCPKCDQEAAYLRDEMNKIPEQERKYPQHILKDWEKALCLAK